MKRSFILCAAILLLFVAGGAHAQNMSNNMDAPAATLLLPYFEVDLNSTAGPTTVFSVNNASATAILAHVTIWSDLAVPVFAFNIYLTGYDVQVVDLRAFFNGTVPRTASDGQDPQDTISPQGNFSQDINFASCTGQLPLPNLAPTSLDHLRKSLTGQPSSFLVGKCAGRNLGDNVARGFITVDTVNNCTLRVAGQLGYFGPGGTGDATNQNVMWGDYAIIAQGTNQTSGGPLLHIRASATDPRTSVPGNYTFYGAAANWIAADNRQPLGTTYATRFMLNTLYFPSGTSLIVWRDPKMKQDPFTCGVNPPWYPLPQEGVVAFNEQEQPLTVASPTNIFPAATQRVVVGGAALPVPYNRGWLYLNLNANVAAAGAVPPADPNAAQAYVANVFSWAGRYSAGSRATALDNASAPNHYTPQ